VLPGSTLFLDVCAQRDLWPGGAWPMVTVDEAGNVAELFTLAARLGVRQGGVVCLHAVDAAAPPAAVASAGVPLHCVAGTAGAERAPGCLPASPVRLAAVDTQGGPALDRAHAYYVATGCAAAPDATPADRHVLDHLTAGVRDAVVFGAGIEHAMDHAVQALLRRRIRTHVVLDAAGAADATTAQRVIARWKRATVDGATTATIARLLTRTAPP
jgi:nicotinamidase-related amidase